MFILKQRLLGNIKTAKVNINFLLDSTVSAQQFFFHVYYYNLLQLTPNVDFKFIILQLIETIGIASNKRVDDEESWGCFPFFSLAQSIEQLQLLNRQPGLKIDLTALNAKSVSK